MTDTQTHVKTLIELATGDATMLPQEREVAVAALGIVGNLCADIARIADAVEQLVKEAKANNTNFAP